MASILEEVLLEEHVRSQETIAAFEEELQGLPKGYLRARKIGNGTYFYLQHREGKQVVSRYVPRGDVPLLKKKIEKRKKLEEGIRIQKKNLRQIERALGKESFA